MHFWSIICNYLCFFREKTDFGKSNATLFISFMLYLMHRVDFFAIWQNFSVIFQKIACFFGNISKKH